MARRNEDRAVREAMGKDRWCAVSTEPGALIMAQIDAGGIWRMLAARVPADFTDVYAAELARKTIGIGLG